MTSVSDTNIPQTQNTCTVIMDAHLQRIPYQRATTEEIKNSEKFE